MKIISYHTYHSSGIGGVETLLRHLKKTCSDGQVAYIEVYHGVMGSIQYPNSKTIDDIQLSGYSLGYNLFGSIARKISLLYFFWSYDFNKGDILILFHPLNLVFIPFWIRRKLKIILVQINRADIYLNSVNSTVVNVYNNNIYRMVVYTERDVDALTRICPNLRFKCSVIPRGCKLPISSPRVLPNKKLVTIARIEECQKNFKQMVDVVGLLPDDYTLDIYGDGSEQEISMLLERIKDIPRVRYMGVTKDVQTCLKEYSVFLMTSNYEGFGQTLIEARSQGLPVVLFDTFDAASWIVQNGINGYLVKNNDIYLFSEKIRFLCENENEYATVSLGAIKTAATTDRDIINDKWFYLLTSQG